MEYKLNATAAKQADNKSSRIEETGKYLGVFTRAEYVVSKNGAKGIDFSFVSDDEQTADYLTVWTHGRDGKEIYGYKVLNAIMTCLEQREIKTENGEIEKWNPEIQKREKTTVPLFKGLMGKRIGLLLQMEEYVKNDGSSAWKPTIYAPFNKNEFTSSEILNGDKQPVLLGKMVQSLKNRPLKGATQTKTQSTNANPFNDMDDDIPF